MMFAAQISQTTASTRDNYVIVTDDLVNDQQSINTSNIGDIIGDVFMLVVLLTKLILFTLFYLNYRLIILFGSNVLEHKTAADK